MAKGFIHGPGLDEALARAYKRGRRVDALTALMMVFGRTYEASRITARRIVYLFWPPADG